MAELDQAEATSAGFCSSLNLSVFVVLSFLCPIGRNPMQLRNLRNLVFQRLHWNSAVAAARRGGIIARRTRRRLRRTPGGSAVV